MQTEIAFNTPIPSAAAKRFGDFHEANPQVYRELEKLAWQAHERGRRKIGMQMLFEVLRWNRIMQTQGDDYKLNNNYAGRYARLIMEKNPELEGIFETRELRS